MPSSNSVATIRILSRAVRCSTAVSLLSDLSKRGSTYRIPVFNSRLYFSWRDFQPNMLFLPPVCPAQLTIGVVFTIEESLLLLDFYTDFICKMAVKAISLIPGCMDLVSVDRRRL